MIISRQSTVKFDSLCTVPQSGTCLNKQKKTDFIRPIDIRYCSLAWPACLVLVAGRHLAVAPRSGAKQNFYCTEAGLLNKRLMLSSSFRCDQIYKYKIYNFGHTLLCYLSPTQMFNELASVYYITLNSKCEAQRVSKKNLKNCG